MAEPNLLDDLPKDLPKALREEIQSAEQNLQKLVDELLTEVGQEPIPPILYHYTDSSGLRGMLEGRKLWLTNIFYLNDPAELRHGIGFAAKALASAALAGSKPLGLFSRIFADFQSEGVERAADMFVACFSAERDDLGQWRAYASDGKGYAIGFDRAALDGAFMKAGMSPGAFPIRYQDGRLKAIQAALVGEVVPIIEKTASGGLSTKTVIEVLKVLSVMLSMQVISASLYFKHPAYENERERRYLRMHRDDEPVKDLKLRMRNDALVSYVEFDWKSLGDDAVKEIVVGPAAQSGVGERFVRDCLRAFSFDPKKIKIRKSEIPYRSG
jgi:hypothetical protein